MGNTIGNIFRITTWGESHGKTIGVVIDGCPPFIDISEDEIQVELDRRKPGQNRLVTPRKESDQCKINSGVFEGKTTGTPICIYVKNKDQNSKDYDEIKKKYRPSHADLTYDLKYGFRDYRGGGRSSARETIGRVAAGVIAKKVIIKMNQKSSNNLNTDTIAYVKQIGDIKCDFDSKKMTDEKKLSIEKNLVRTPDANIALEMEELIREAKKNGDSLGGIIECLVKNPPTGLGEPVFDKLEADIAKAMLSIPATKGIEFGSGFFGASQYGSEQNDEFIIKNNKISTKTNNSGGIQGGITNGEDIIFRVAFKPTATIRKEQRTVDINKNETTLAAKGRHDPCVLPRAVPIVEAMTNIVLCDHYLRNIAQCT